MAAVFDLHVINDMWTWQGHKQQTISERTSRNHFVISDNIKTLSQFKPSGQQQSLETCQATVATGAISPWQQFFCACSSPFKPQHHSQ